ncbi:hypothetical protein [Roseobacter sp. S98]|uniref:hypothetical protein n=1 Tax=Roseobacter algicola (ex Choi et al. 2025) (nom. illeg.) TaxID=3092138 RepID=UPI0035C6EFAC
MAIARLFLMGFVVLSVVYACLWFFFRARRREKLEATWDAGKGDGSRAQFVRSGLERYHRPLKRNLILGVYVLPTAALALLIYLTNSA